MANQRINELRGEPLFGPIKRQISIHRIYLERGSLPHQEEAHIFFSRIYPPGSDIKEYVH